MRVVYGMPVQPRAAAAAGHGVTRRIPVGVYSYRSALAGEEVLLHHVALGHGRLDVEALHRKGIVCCSRWDRADHGRLLHLERNDVLRRSWT